MKAVETKLGRRNSGMHILFFSHYFPPEVNAPATRTYEHCRRWVAAGHRVTVITCAPNCPAGVVFEGYKNSWQTEETLEGIRVLRVWTYLSPNKGFARRIANYLSYLLSATLCSLFVRKIDVIVATSPQFFCGWAGVLSGWIRRRPFVLEVRDLWPESIVTVGAMKRSAAVRLLEWLERRMYAAAARIVTVGNGYRLQLQRRGVPERQIVVIPNGVDATQFKPQQRPAPLRADWEPAGRFVCAYIGTVGMAHGLDVVLRAARMLADQGRRDVVFWIVGDGAERARLEHEARAQALGNVRFTGLIAKSRIAEVIAACDACLVHLRQTDLFETVIPSKIFELMAMNTPIIMGVRGEAQQIVLSAGAGVAMEPEDADSLLAAVSTIAASPDAFRRGRQYVAEFFDRGRLARRMLDELTAVVDRGGASAAAKSERPVQTPAERRAA